MVYYGYGITTKEDKQEKKTTHLGSVVAKNDA